MSGEPFVLRPADVETPYRRWQLVDSLVQPEGTVQVEFFDDTNGHYRITGTYYGKQHTTLSHATVNNGDQNEIVVLATSFHRRSQISATSQVTWPGGTIADTPFAVPTKNIISIENVDGPVRSIEIDPERLRDAIYHALADRIGPTAEVAPGIVTEIITNYERD